MQHARDIYMLFTTPSYSLHPLYTISFIYYTNHSFKLFLPHHGTQYWYICFTGHITCIKILTRQLVQTRNSCGTPPSSDLPHSILATLQLLSIRKAKSWTSQRFMNHSDSTRRSRSGSAVSPSHWKRHFQEYRNITSSGSLSMEIRTILLQAIGHTLSATVLFYVAMCAAHATSSMMHSQVCSRL